MPDLVSVPCEGCGCTTLLEQSLVDRGVEWTCWPCRDSGSDGESALTGVEFVREVGHNPEKASPSTVAEACLWSFEEIVRLRAALHALAVKQPSWRGGFCTLCDSALYADGHREDCLLHGYDPSGEGS